MKSERDAPSRAAALCRPACFRLILRTRTVAAAPLRGSARPADVSPTVTRPDPLVRENAAFRIPPSCSSFRTTTFSHALQPGREPRRAGIPRKDGAKNGGKVETDARKIWRKFAEHYIDRGTPTGCGSIRPSPNCSR